MTLLRAAVLTLALAACLPPAEPMLKVAIMNQDSQPHIVQEHGVAQPRAWVVPPAATRLLDVASSLRLVVLRSDCTPQASLAEHSEAFVTVVISADGIEIRPNPPSAVVPDAPPASRTEPCRDVPPILP